MSTQVSWIRQRWIRLTQWEYWPFSVLYFPVFFYYAWLVIRHRSFFFFTSSNPSIEFAGMMGERKSDIYGLIPQEFLPRYRKFQPGDVEAALAYASDLGYPLVGKPDIGERGTLVERLHNSAEVENYAGSMKVPFLFQELVSWPVELGIFYVKKPDESTGRVTSLVQKDFLQVIGDGQHTVRQLLQMQPRALLQLDFNHPRFASVLRQIPSAGERVVVEAIGNHCRGTVFLNQNHLIDEALNRAFQQIASTIPQFHFGRFDLRCASLDDLKQLKNFKILELNGAGAEPGHIYQPGYSLWKGYKAIFWHLKVLSQISRSNQQRGHRYWTFQEGWRKIKAVRSYQRLIQPKG